MPRGWRGWPARRNGSRRATPALAIRCESMRSCLRPANGRAAMLLLAERDGLAEDILTNASRVDISERRAAFEDEGWAQFDPAASPYSAEEIRDYRARVLPPII